MTSIQWAKEVVDGSIRQRFFQLEANARQIPGVLWMPAQSERRSPVVLVGHGGSQSKDASAVLDVVVPMVSQHGFAVVAIDGPVHGDRRADQGRDSALVIQDFRLLWKKNPSITSMTSDWKATVDALSALPELNCNQLAWFGLSMGTAYGLPLCAAEPRIKAALLGMWGTSHPHGDLLLEAARNVLCPVEFHRKLADERFSAEGQKTLFDALASSDKILKDYPGGHVNPADVQLQEALDFLCKHLGATPDLVAVR